MVFQLEDESIDAKINRGRIEVGTNQNRTTILSARAISRDAKAKEAA